MKNRYLIFWIILLFSILQVLPFVPSSQVHAQGTNLVYVIPVEHEIERGLERFLARSFKEAEEAMADAIILEINTLGGFVDSAINIGNLIKREHIPVIAYIKVEAISAGSYISLNADKIYMEPGSHIGAAAVRSISGEEVDPKITSLWVSHMRDAAKQHGRDPDIAEAMVNPNMEIQGLTRSGELVTLDSQTAFDYGISDGTVQNRAELLTKLGMTNPSVIETNLSPAERLARFVTNPYVIPVLLIIGIAGILLEIFIPGFGVAGIIGISSFGLYFFGHFFAGFAGWEAILFFLAGFVLMGIELFVPGFGIFGILGIIAFSMGISLAAYETSYGLFSLAIAFVINIILAIILAKYFGKRGLWQRFILKDEQKKESGYVSHTKKRDIVGKRGKTVTKLRPSGLAIIEGKKYDVVSEGDFINANEEIEILMVEGTRIVVKKID